MYYCYYCHSYCKILTIIVITIKGGWTPLHYAAWKGREEAVRILLANGADPNCQNNVSININCIYIIVIISLSLYHRMDGYLFIMQLLKVISHQVKKLLDYY